MNIGFNFPTLLLFIAALVMGASGAYAQSRFSDIANYFGSAYGYPFMPEGLSLTSPAEYCVDPLNIYSLSEMQGLSYTLSPAVADHVGRQGYAFLALRLLGQPDKLIVPASNQTALQTVWREVDSQALPVVLNTLDYRPVELFPDEPPYAGTKPPYLTYLGASFYDSPVDLRPLFGNVELLAGYGLPPLTSSTATAADAFQEMLDAGRYAVVWPVGATTSAYKLCFTYDRVRTHLYNEIVGGFRPQYFKTDIIRPSQTSNLPAPSPQPAPSFSGYPLGEVQLPESREHCQRSVTGTADSYDPATGAVGRVSRLEYTLIAEHAAHIGRRADIYVGYYQPPSEYGQPDYLWLLGPNSLTTRTEFAPDMAPVPYFGDQSITLASHNAITLLDLPSGAGIDLGAAIGTGGILVVGYGLRGEEGDTPAASFREMLASRRYNGISQRYWFATQNCFEYSKVRVKPASN